MTGKTPGPNEWLSLQRGKAAQADHPAAPPCNVEESIDSRVEQFLISHGVKFAPKSMIPVGLIDEKQSLSNQARDVPIIPESVDRFTASIKKGEYLPPIVVFPSGNRVVIVDGNNRYASHKKAGSQFIPGYVIDEHTPSETIALLTVASNTGHGVTPDLNWRKRQAAHLVSVGFTAETACEAAGITKPQLTDFMALQRADARARAMKITQGWSELPAAARISLGRIPLDSVFYQAAHTAISTDMNSDETRILLRDIKALGNEAAQVQHIVKVGEDRKVEAKAKAATGASGRVSSPKQALVTALGKIMHLDPAALARQTLTELDRQLLIRRLDEAGRKLIEIQIALEEGRVDARDAG